MNDVSKDLVFQQPTVESEYSSSGRSPRDWTVAEVEEAMWRIRASGGTDSTPVKFSYKAEDSIRALHVEAFPIEVPRSRLANLQDAETDAVGPTADPWFRVKQAAVVVVLVALLPAVGIPVAYLWGWFFTLLT